MESKNIINEETYYDTYEIASMLGINYKAAHKRVLRAKLNQTKQKRILFLYSGSELDKLKIPHDKRFLTETYLVFESKMNFNKNL